MKLSNPHWWHAAGIRAVRTAAQAAIAAIGSATVLNQVDWAVIGSTVCVATILSLLTSLASLPEWDDQDKVEEE